MNRRAFLSLVAAGPLVAALKPWRPPVPGGVVPTAYLGARVVEGQAYDVFLTEQLHLAARAFRISYEDLIELPADLALRMARDS